MLGTLAFLGGAFWVQTIQTNLNTQKQHSAIYKACLLQLQNQQELINRLGNDIKGSEKIKGKIDMLGGIADVEFGIEGSKDKGMVKLVAKRLNLDFWDSKIKVTIPTQDNFELNL